MAVYVVLGLILIFLLLLVVAYINAVIKFPKTTLIVTAILVFGAKLYCDNFVESTQFGHAPYWLNIKKITYSKEESWGIGMPGDNETGVIVYDLQSEIAEKIKKEGIEFFKHLPQVTYSNNGEYYRRGSYDNWSEMPIKKKKYSNEDEKTKVEALTDIDEYLNKYGFGISVDPKIKAQINHAISKVGSYYAYGRYGMLIIIPEQHKVVYMYAG